MNCEHGYADGSCPTCGKAFLGDLNEDGQSDAVDAAIVLVAAASVGSGGESGLTEMSRCQWRRCIRCIGCSRNSLLCSSGWFGLYWNIGRISCSLIG